MLFYTSIILIISVILMIIEYLWINYYKKNFKKILMGDEAEIRFEKNIDNEKNIKNYFRETIKKRLELLKTMSYDEWLEYNKKNTIIEYNGLKYYTFVYESANFDKKYIVRSTLNEDMLDRNHIIERDMLINEYGILEQFPPYENLPEEMLMMSTDKNGFNNISYNWLHGFLNIPVKYNTIFSKFKKDDFKGVIGISYAKEDLLIKYLDIYYNFLDTPNLIIINLAIVFIAVMIYLINDEYENFVKSVAILILSWVYLMWQLSLTATTTTIKIETEKIKELSQSVLGASFLMGVNIFVINLLDNKNRLVSKLDVSKIRKVIVFLFFMVVVFLLASLVKTNNFKSANDLRRLRINNQIYYNFSIFYNLTICVILITLIFKNVFEMLVRRKLI